jgi:adenylate cyclase
MATDELIDIDEAGTVTNRHRMWSRIAIPIGGVILILAAMMVITLYSESANRSGVLLLSDELLASLNQRISAEVTAYLEPATRATRLAHDMARSSAIADPREALRLFAVSALRYIPQIDAMYSADTNGDFIMVRRGVADGTDTKVISNAAGQRSVQSTHWNAEGVATASEQDTNDQYDPRTRDWYQTAIKGEDLYWSGVYVFFTARAPGVTAAMRYRDGDSDYRVFGVDITLDALSDFLASLKIGRTGRAAIIDGDGRLIAAPGSSRLMRERDGQLATVRVDQAGDAYLAAAFDHLRIEGYGRRLVNVGVETVMIISSPLQVAGRGWSLLIAVPEADFTGFVVSNARRSLWLSMIVVGLSALLALLLVRQGLRADRTANFLLARGRAMQRQGNAFVTLVNTTGLLDASDTDAIRSLTETMADLASARRVSIWRLRSAAGLLHCDDAYEPGVNGGHEAGLHLARSEMPRFFDTLEVGDAFLAADAKTDPRTVELHRVLMHSIGARSTYVAPIHDARRVIGAVVLEDPGQLDDALAFLGLVAGVLTVRWRGIAEPVPVPSAKPSADRSPKRSREEASGLLSWRQGDVDDDARHFSSAAVMVIKFDDAESLERGNGARQLADRIAVALQQIAVAHDIPYMKLAGHEVTAAAGFAPDDDDGALRIADASIAIRDYCTELLGDSGQRLVFHIGIDTGLVIAGHVGREPRVFNLWGEVVRTAGLMAQTAAGTGIIQVSESTFELLRESFLMRLRGSFYRPSTGPEQTFVLGSRQ